MAMHTAPFTAGWRNLGWIVDERIGFIDWEQDYFGVRPLSKERNWSGYP